jgi:hypothetical protein
MSREQRISRIFRSGGCEGRGFGTEVDKIPYYTIKPPSLILSQEFSQPDDRGLWRFGIISPLLHCAEDVPTVSAQLNERVKGRWQISQTPIPCNTKTGVDSFREMMYNCNVYVIIIHYKGKTV